MSHCWERLDIETCRRSFKVRPRRRRIIRLPGSLTLSMSLWEEAENKDRAPCLILTWLGLVAARNNLTSFKVRGVHRAPSGTYQTVSPPISPFITFVRQKQRAIQHCLLSFWAKSFASVLLWSMMVMIVSMSKVKWLLLYPGPWSRIGIPPMLHQRDMPWYNHVNTLKWRSAVRWNLNFSSNWIPFLESSEHRVLVIGDWYPYHHTSLSNLIKYQGSKNQGRFMGSYHLTSSCVWS